MAARFKTHLSTGLLFLAIVIAAPVSGCFDGTFYCDDHAEDQTGSFMPPIDFGDPAIIEVDRRFSGAQVLAIQEAVAVWNAFSHQQYGRAFFDLRSADVSGTHNPKRENDCGFDGSSDSRFKIIREDSELQWRSLGLDGRNPGVTIRCRRGDTLAKQAILINTQNARSEQLTSIVLHELGHALGLDHSCLLDGGTKNYASCMGLPEGHAYREAVMYPTLRVGSTASSIEQKNNLRQNDRERADCLYREN